MNKRDLKLLHQEGRELGFGKYPVIILDHVLIPLKCGINLAAKLWFPSETADFPRLHDSPRCLFSAGYDDEGVTNSRFPTIIEYLPYRKSDDMASVDHRHHAWFASHGYVGMRVELRGCGNSEGVLHGEYLQQEFDDCLDVFDWVVAQQWSSGTIGMYGKSWGGLNGLMMAQTQCPHLKAVISMYQSDDRFRTDTHHDGGCIIADEFFRNSSEMLSWQAQAPDPRFDTSWRKTWKTRLEKAGDHWGSTWLKHPCKDEFWMEGSVCADYSKVDCPILAIGGLMDGFVDSIFRLVENIPTCWGIVGPWTHGWPDIGLPGPNMDLMKVSLQWYDYHLKGITTNGALDAPRIRVYSQASYRPAPVICYSDGRWIAVDNWPSPQVTMQETVIYEGGLHINDSRAVVENDIEECWQILPFNVDCGMMVQGAWLSYGNDGPSNQAIDDGLSLSFTSRPFQQDMTLLGYPVFNVTFRLVKSAKAANLMVRLCDVHPDGHSTRISYGMLNLLQRHGHAVENAAGLTVGEVYQATVQMHLTSYCVPTGHRLRFCVSLCSYPQIWPPATKTHLEVLTAADTRKSMDKSSRLLLPVLNTELVKPYVDERFICKNPSIGPQLSVITLAKPYFDFMVTKDIKNDRTTRIIDRSEGRIYDTYPDVIITNDCKEIYEISLTDENVKAKATVQCYYVIEYPDVDGEGHLKMEVKTESSLSADEESYYLSCSVKTLCNEEHFYSRKWNEVVARENN